MFYKIAFSFESMLQALSGAFWAAALVLYAPIALVLGYAYKTWAGFQSTKKNYMYTLTQSLYYQNLDNNAGLLYRILDEAEEQESREAILGYFFLWRMRVNAAGLRTSWTTISNWSLRSGSI